MLLLFLTRSLGSPVCLPKTRHDDARGNSAGACETPASGDRASASPSNPDEPTMVLHALLVG